MDYKDSLNLPQTAFPMKASLSQREPEGLKRWNEERVYETLREVRKGAPKFILHDGPPYANGDIHLGTAANKILKDFILKSQSLSGKDVPYIPGWDCHGLPIELNVEKKHGKPGQKLTPDQFRNECRYYAMQQVEKQRETFMRLGVLGDWFNPYLTMDFKYEANIIRALGKIIEHGHVVQGFKPVYWCVDCGSALAEAEVEYKDKHSPSIDVRFAVLNEAHLLSKMHHVDGKQGEGKISAAIWTTTPWTLPANQAVAFHPKLEYALVECHAEHGKERLLIADALLKDTMNRYDIDEYRVVAYAPGAELEGIMLQHPFYDREVPIVLGEHVTTDSGTGAVHTAPGHGQEDYVVGKKYNLPIDNPVGSNGCFLSDTPIFAGEHVYKANPHVIDVLKAKGALIREEAIEHSYPHCWRHKTPLIFRATPQWFISMDQNHLRETAVEAIAQVDWLPDWGQARISDMVMNRPDWCISRQRTWGVPIPLFVHRESGALHPDTKNLIESVAKAVEEKGIDAWFDATPETFLAKDADQYEKITDTLDVWFDSGVSHECVMKARDELGYPADIYIEGSDQHRGWFQSSLLTACAINASAPYREVITHGYVVDGKGYKMSKSLGNVVKPIDLINKYGADIVRLWVSSLDYTKEMGVSDEMLKRISDAYRRIRNTARFFLSNLDGFNPEKDLVDSKEMIALDQWAVAMTKSLQDEIIAAYDRYEFLEVYQKVHHFCSIEMGSFYLDVIKDRLYTTKSNSLARRSAQTAIFHILEAMVRWVAPILSFTADEIWQFMPGERAGAVFLSTWYDKLDAVTPGKMDLGFWNEMMLVRDEVNRQIEILRSDGVLGSALEAVVTLYAEGPMYDALNRLGNELRFLLITSEATLKPLSDAGDAVDTTLGGLKIAIQASTDKKCIRCWHRREEIGHDVNHPEICDRCIENVSGAGEERQFV